MTIEDLKETAALAHLNLEESELAVAFPAFEQMLGYFAAMQAADEDKAAFPAYSVSPSPGIAGASGNSRMAGSSFFRPDSPADSSLNNNPSPGLNEKLLNNSGERDGRFLVIPNVL